MTFCSQNLKTHRVYLVSVDVKDLYIDEVLFAVHRIRYCNYTYCRQRSTIFSSKHHVIYVHICPIIIFSPVAEVIEDNYFDYLIYGERLLFSGTSPERLYAKKLKLTKCN